MIWTREQAKAVIDRALSMSKAEETFVVVNGTDRGNLRFARNTATTSGASTGHSLAVTASFGKKSGSATTSEFDDASLRQAVANAEEIARLSPDNPEAMPVLGPQTYGVGKAYFEDVAKRDARVACSGRRDGHRDEPAERGGLGRVRGHVGVDAGGGHVERAVRLGPPDRGRLQPDRLAPPTAWARGGRRSRSTSCACSNRGSSPRPRSTRLCSRGSRRRSSRASTPWCSNRRPWPISSRSWYSAPTRARPTRAAASSRRRAAATGSVNRCSAKR